MIDFNGICDPKWHLKGPEEFFTASLDITRFFLFILFVCLFRHSSLHPGTRLQKEGHTSLSKISVVPMPVPRKICLPSCVVLLFLLSLLSLWLMVFSSISMVSLFEADDNTDDLVSMGEKTHTTVCLLRHTDAVRFRMKAEHICFIQTVMKWNSLAVSTHTLGSVHYFEDGVGGGGGLLSAWDAYGIWCDWAFILFACWSTPEAILFSRSFHLLLDPVYRLSPASRTKRSVSASIWYRRLLFF